MPDSGWSFFSESSDRHGPSPYLVATLTTATTMIIASDSGMSTSHENRCSWSSRSLG